MRSALPFSPVRDESLIAAIFPAIGKWHSERRYYTLADGTAKEIMSILTVRFLPQGYAELPELAQLHNFTDATAMTCGTFITWDSTTAASGQQQSQGVTRFGVVGNVLYRDRGFATSQPITAIFAGPNAHTLCWRTEYNGSVFEEEHRCGSADTDHLSNSTKKTDLFRCERIVGRLVHTSNSVLSLRFHLIHTIRLLQQFPSL
jgi:CpeS-like protein